MKRECTITIVDMGNLRAIANVQLDGIEICGFKIINNGQGLWIAPPSREFKRNGTNAFHDLVRFTTKEASKELTQWILESYEKELGQYRVEVQMHL